MEAARLNVLALHGKQQCASVFEQRLKSLIKKSENVASYFFIDAPHELPQRDDQMVPMRTWMDPEGSWNDAVHAVIQKCQKLQEAGQTIDILLGFSQGAALIPVLLQQLPSKYLDAIRCVIMAGGLLLPNSPCPVRLHNIPSLHLIGKEDPVVSLSASKDLAALFENPTIVMHDRGHIVPQNASDCKHYLSMFEAVLETISSSSSSSAAMNEEQQEELEALEAIYGPDLTVVSKTPELCVSVCVAEDAKEAPDDERLRVIFTMPSDYPESQAPKVNVNNLRQCLHVSREHEAFAKQKLLSEIQTVVDENIGSAMVFLVVAAAQEWMEHFRSDPDNLYLLRFDQDNNEGGDAKNRKNKVLVQMEDEDFDHLSLVRKAAAEAAATDAALRAAGKWSYATRGGQWPYVLGLVGKPSAGKSTLFNALITATDARTVAKVAAFPFTTIEPNVAQAYFCTPRPSYLPSNQISHPMHGSIGPKGDHRVPVVLKDVAGLVPGAYQGRGRGNMFLNDLCDADVLIHVVDGSGKTDENGDVTDSYDPAQDIDWVMAEVHQWIFGNVVAKWDRIVKNPLKLAAMFSGYHCQPNIVSQALERAGVLVEKDLVEQLPQWDVAMVHTLVAHFLRLRFPTVVAVNKLDTLDNPNQFIEQLRTQKPHETIVAMSAKAECELTKYRDNELLLYDSLSGRCDVQHSSAAYGKLEATKQDLLVSRIDRIRKGVLTNLPHGTGVLHVVNTAVGLKPPLIIFPVRSLSTLASYPVPGRRNTTEEFLRDIVLMHPTSTVNDLYVALKSLKLLGGDFVRAEVLTSQGATRPLKKIDQLTRATEVVCVMTNKKVAWQSSATPQS